MKSFSIPIKNTLYSYYLVFHILTQNTLLDLSNTGILVFLQNVSSLKERRQIEFCILSILYRRNPTEIDTKDHILHLQQQLIFKFLSKFSSDYYRPEITSLSFMIFYYLKGRDLKLILIHLKLKNHMHSTFLVMQRREIYQINSGK